MIAAERMRDEDSAPPQTTLAEELGQPQLDPAVRSELVKHLDHLALVFREIQEQADRLGVKHIPSILARHRTEVYRTAIAIGDWLNEFLASGPAPSQVQALRQQVVAIVRELSRTSPILQLSLGKPRALGGDLELITWLLDERPVGADLSAMVLNDFYRSSVSGRAYRGQLQLLINAVNRQIERQVAAGNDPVRVLSLHVSGVSALLTPEEVEALAAHAWFTCLDANPQTLRATARSLPQPLRKRVSFTRADAVRYVVGPDRPAHSFDIMYGAGLVDHLSPARTVQLVQGCYSLLRPGGMLLLGCTTPDLPPGEQVFRAWVMDRQVYYRDEAAWREILAPSGFDLGTLRFEYEPLRASMLVSVVRLP